MEVVFRRFIEFFSENKVTRNCLLRVKNLLSAVPKFNLTYG